jgi:RimJ/RimL family protein N-acetyltransferase
MSESHDQSRADAERDLLMPRSAPRPSPRHPADRHTRRYGSNQNEREYAMLAEQLEALEHDIKAVEHEIDDARTISRRLPGLTRHSNHEATPRTPRGQAIALPDGARILIRPIEPGDARQLGLFFDQLGEVSRYRRFLTPIDHLSARQLALLTQLDRETHEALVAVDATTGELVGVTRYVCDPDDKGQAEIAVVVADGWQVRGAGTALVEMLTSRARAAGIDRFKARILIGDQASRRLLGHVADLISEREDGGTARLTARVRGPGEQTPSPPAHAKPSRP